jgi:hypothetical protein
MILIAAINLNCFIEIISSNLFDKSKDIIKWLAENETRMKAHKMLIARASKTKHFHNSFHLSNHNDKKMNIQSIYFQFDIIKFSANQSFVSWNSGQKFLTFKALRENQFITETRKFYYLLTVVQNFTGYMHGNELQFKVFPLLVACLLLRFPFLWHSQKTKSLPHIFHIFISLTTCAFSYTHKFNHWAKILSRYDKKNSFWWLSLKP